MYARHFVLGTLSCADAGLSTAVKMVYCNCEDKDFILRAHRLPLYDSLYFHMFYKGQSHVGKQIICVGGDNEIDDIMEQQLHM